MIQRRFFIALLGLSATYLSLYSNLVEPEAQAQTSATDDESPRVNVQGMPFGIKSGEEELQALLEFSQPTQSPSIRKVVIPIPTSASGTRMPDEALNQLPGVSAIAEFHRIVERESSPPGRPDQDNFEVEGKKGRLPGGGILHLQVNSKKSPVTAIINISGYKAPGYEQVRRIEFVLPQTPAL